MGESTRSARNEHLLLATEPECDGEGGRKGSSSHIPQAPHLWSDLRKGIPHNCKAHSMHTQFLRKFSSSYFQS